MSESPFNGFSDEVAEDDAPLISTRGLESFGRKVSTTASHIMAANLSGVGTGESGSGVNSHYHLAMTQVHKQLTKPSIQRGVFALARTTPTDMVRSKFSRREIQHRALTTLSDEMLRNIPKIDNNTYSLFQGFQASHPEMAEDENNKTGSGSGANRLSQKGRLERSRKLLRDAEDSGDPYSPQTLIAMKRDKASLTHDFEMLGVRKNMATCEIREIDNKISNLAGMRRILMERLASLEQDEALLEHDIMDIEARIHVTEGLIEQDALKRANSPTRSERDLVGSDDESLSSGFMSKSVYDKLPHPHSSAASTTSRSKKPRTIRRKSMPVLHEYFETGSNIKEFRAHQDTITALDFDTPFGLMVTSALDDSLKVWDLNAGRCIGILDGHTASVRTLQIEDNILATGSVDATIRLWDMSKAHYDPQGSQFGRDEDDGIAFENPDDEPVDPPEGSMADCPLYTLESHVDEITALHFRGDVLVSGSADKTIRHWDLEKGRCVQTLDVMWAAAQASATLGSDNGWIQTGRAMTPSADFVGALQVFESALACGTADGMVRLWDLRSGQVHRSLMGHTGAVTCLQFDDVYLVTGSMDRSIRIWDLRTGAIHDAFAYDNPITSMMFDTRRIVSAAGEDVVKVYDKVEGRQWDCGAGVTAAEEGKSPAIIERINDTLFVSPAMDYTPPLHDPDNPVDSSPWGTADPAPGTSSPWATTADDSPQAATGGFSAVAAIEDEGMFGYDPTHASAASNVVGGGFSDAEDTGGFREHVLDVDQQTVVASEAPDKTSSAAVPAPDVPPATPVKSQEQQRAAAEGSTKLGSSATGGQTTVQQQQQQQPQTQQQQQFRLTAKITGLERPGKKDPILRFDVYTNLTRYRTTQYRDVRRLHSEFVKLAEHLISANPEALVPAVPPACTSAGAGTSEDEARVKALMQRWFNVVCSNDVLMRDDEMVLFVESDFGYSPMVRIKQPATGVRRKILKQFAPPPDDTPELSYARPAVKLFYLGTMDAGHKVDKLVRARRGLGLAESDFGVKIGAMHVQEPHQGLANAYRKFGKIVQTVGDCHAAQATAEATTLGDPFQYHSQDSFIVKETLTNRQILIREFLQAQEQTRSRLAAADRLKASSSVRREKVDEAIASLDEARALETHLFQKTTRVTRNLVHEQRKWITRSAADLRLSVREFTLREIEAERRILAMLESVRPDIRAIDSSGGLSRLGREAHPPVRRAGPAPSQGPKGDAWSGIPRRSDPTMRSISGSFAGPGAGVGVVGGVTPGSGPEEDGVDSGVGAHGGVTSALLGGEDDDNRLDARNAASRLAASTF
ncbi:Mitochondrial division protein 1 [Ceratocystis platani]|uniref:Mitochondrial division protein 1 n=1 Tax=Ceratocystis fimbriata f. sp. platani TaxID=88771 RepID=A0A0F8BKG7_CERFI|nr:Mitochondrial division protein 1 [Ceratocystis platani]